MFKFNKNDWEQIDLPCGKVGFALAPNQANKLIKDKITTLHEHFVKGGGVNPQVLAGAMEVTTTTITEWQNINSKYFNPYFCALLDYYEGVGAQKIMSTYTAVALGEDIIVNIKLLERLALQYIPQPKSKDSIIPLEDLNQHKSPEDLEAQIKAIEADLI